MLHRFDVLLLSDRAPVELRSCNITCSVEQYLQLVHTHYNYSSTKILLSYIRYHQERMLAPDICSIVINLDAHMKGYENDMA